MLYLPEQFKNYYAMTSIYLDRNTLEVFFMNKKKWIIALIISVLVTSLIITAGFFVFK
jgi:hypothetical protein